MRSNTPRVLFDIHSSSIRLLFFVKVVICCRSEPSKQLFSNDPIDKSQVDLSGFERGILIVNYDQSTTIMPCSETVLQKLFHD